MIVVSQKTQTRAVRASESHQPRLVQMKEDLRRANEVIASLEDEKAKALDELLKARKDAEEASEKVEEALKAQREAEESSEIEKFEAVEAGIEAVQRKEEEMKKEIERLKSNHASEASAALRELERVRQELVAANEAKSKAQSEADEATKMAAIHEEKVEILSSELIRLKALLDSTREKETISNKEIASKLGGEIDVLRRELEKARGFEAEVKEVEMVVERLKGELEAAQGCAEEWRNRAEELEEADELKRSALVSLVTVRKQLEESDGRLEGMESKVTDLKEKIRLLETVVARKEEALEECEERLSVAEVELSKAERELETVKEEVLKKERDAMEERSKLLSELGRWKEEEEKSKKAMESLASALHEVSSEARELKESERQVEDLKLVMRETSDKYEKMLEEARHEIDVLVNAVEQTKRELESSVVDWEMREAGLVSHVKRFDEEVSSMSKEMNRLGGLVKRTKEEADAAWKKEAEMRDGLKEVEDEVIYLQETLREARAESFKLNEKMLDKETEFQSVVHENDVLRVKQDESLKKIDELTRLLEEALAEKHDNKVEVSESEKDYDLLEFCEENGHRSVEEKDREEKDDNRVEVEFKMWESCEIEKKEAFPKEKPEQEAPKEEVEDQSEKTSPENMKESREDRVVNEEKEKKIKKKTLFGKVGNLLKKKGPVNQR